MPNNISQRLESSIEQLANEIHELESKLKLFEPGTPQYTGVSQEIRARDRKIRELERVLNDSKRR